MNNPSEVLKSIIWHRGSTLKKYAARKRVPYNDLLVMVQNCHLISKLRQKKLAVLLEIDYDELQEIIKGHISFLDWLRLEDLRIRALDLSKSKS